MLYTFNYRAEDSLSDAGTASVTIVADGKISAKAYLERLLVAKQRTDLKFKLISSRPYHQGVVCDDIEERNNVEGIWKDQRHRLVIHSDGE